MSFLRSAVTSRLAYAVEQSERFEAFHAANADLEIRAYVNLFTQDDVLTRILEGLRQHLDTAPKEWHAASDASGLKTLPEDPAAAMAFRFATFRYVWRKKLDLRHFVTNHYPGEHLNARLMEWKRFFVHPFAADLRLLAELLEQALPQTEWVDLDAAIASCLAGGVRERGFGPRAWTDADDAAWEAAEAAKRRERAAAPTTRVDVTQARETSVEDAFRQLRAALQTSDVLADVAHDLTLDLDALELELQRPTFSPERFAARLDAVALHLDLRSEADALRAALATR